MQIACKRFGCQKAVEVCYWTCKHRKNCKDWAGALDVQPGLVAITERLEMAAAKSGRIFDAKSLVKPVRVKRTTAKGAVPTPIATAVVATAPMIMATAASKPYPKALSQLASNLSKDLPLPAKPVANGTHSKQRPVAVAIKPAKPERKVMPKPEDEKIEPSLEATTPKANGAKSVAKPTAKPKPPTNGPVYLLLSKNGKYKELREADLLKEAANIIKDPSVRLVKGTYLVPQITFKSLDD